MSTKVEIKVMILQVKEYQRRSANQQQLGERHGTQSPSDPLEGTNTALTLILDFQPPEPCYNRFLVLKPSSVCPVLLPGKSHGQRSLVGCSPWGHEESDTTERLHFHFHALEKEMATHSCVLAWRIPGMGEPGGLPSMGSHRVGHD